MAKGSVEDIVRDIYQVVNNASDHAYKEGDDNIGLKREMNKSIHDRRVMDGFNVRIMGNVMYLGYNAELTKQDIHENLDSETEEIMNKIENFLKKEYKSMTGNSLSLSKIEPLKIFVENASSVRYNLRAVQAYEVKDIPFDNEEEKPTEDKLKEAYREFARMRYAS